MTAENGLKWLLRLMALSTCLALIGIVIPPTWLAWFVQKAQPGTPNGILTNYLFRMLMLMYAWAGLQGWIYSGDVRRYIVLIWIIGVGSLVAAAVGVALLFVMVPQDQQTWFFWIVFIDFAEGFVQAVLLVVLLFLVRRRLSPAPCLGAPGFGEGRDVPCSNGASKWQTPSC
jgi:hypothetical protein